ncbi:MAG: hypothetical protein DDT42_00363 [candidate division WS2 bacterium]|uniref:Rubrerythrin diiron-binding domain-containing protein n=1 Tax=Psychracetigena formicireducens TaxID=2986056 RepID=A0A9E2F199_PSYF1|nr:hypothetical protein [Candidatus Psychracetigena formicireducens]MBT9144522.1 hypothetical protein [Candidatus Psychracetigena formicireducens]
MERDILQEIFKTAMEIELTGMSFYNLAAEKSTILQTREVFLSLAKDETQHLSWLVSEAKNYFKSGYYPAPTAFKSPGTFPEIIPTQSIDADFEISALNIGLLLEKNSIEFYRKALTNSKNESSNTLYLKLISWEEKHFNLLQKELEVIRREYWEKAQFQPF